MREIARHGESVWISTQPQSWFDAPVERTLSKTLPAESAEAGSPLFVGYRIIKIYEPRAIYIALGAAYTPARGNGINVESGVIKPTERIAPDAQLNREIAELILTEAEDTLAHCPFREAGTLRFDKMCIHPVDYTQNAWKYAVRILIGLLRITGYEMLTDEIIIAKLVEFAGPSPNRGDSLFSQNGA